MYRMSSIKDSSEIDEVTSYLSRLSLGDGTSSRGPEIELPPSLIILWDSGRVYLTDSLEDGAGSGRRFLNSAFRHILNSNLPRDSVPPRLRAALFRDGGSNDWQRLKPMPDDRLDQLMLNTDITTFLLCACVHEQPPAAIETIADQQMRLDRAFRKPFRGGFVELFQDSLNIYAEIYDKSIYYGRMIPFVQASGTGKSRLAWELGHRMPAFCVCFREGELPTSGWPPRDVNRKFFDGLDGPFTFLAEEKAAAFLGALVEVLHDTAPADLKDWVKAWSIEDPTDLEGSSRHRHFEEVKRLTTERLTKFKKEVHAKRPSCDNTAAAAEAGNNSGVEESGTSVTGWHQLLFQILAKPAFDKLAGSVQRLGYQRFLLSLDECTELNDPALLRGPKGPQRKMSLIALQRIIKAADQFTFPHGIEFWYMLLDTNSSLYELAPSGPDASSYRLAGALKPLPVWCYVDFDQMRRDVELKSAEQALLIRFLAMFGRPYWHTLGDSPDVVRAARKKLIYHDEFDPKNLDHVFAIFANHIVLELSDKKQSSQIAVHAVRSHMRLLTDVSDGFIVTTAPSEPMLAVAAADILNGNRRNYAKAVETLVRRLIIDGVVTDRGRQGDLCTRLLFILTRDKATLPNGGSFVDCPEPARRGVRPLKLSDFLTTLLGDDLGVKDQDKADQVQGLLSDAVNVWMNFTHWTQTDEENSIITPEWLYELWCRGVAVQCTHGQSVFDSLVVTYRGDLTQPFDKSFLGYIVIHTKARMEASALKLAAGLAGPVIETTDESGQPVRYKPTSYIALFMDFTADSTYSGGSRIDIEFEIPKKPSEGKYSSWIGYLQDSAEEKRYCLNVRGNDNQTYPVITKDFKTQFDLLFTHTISTHGHFTKAACAMESAINPISSRLIGNPGRPIPLKSEKKAEKEKNVEGEIEVKRIG